MLPSHASQCASKRTETLPAENDETIRVAGSTSAHGGAPVYGVRKHQWQVDVRASFRVAGWHAPDRAWRVGGADNHETELAGKGSRVHRGEQKDMQKFSPVSHGSALSGASLLQPTEERASDLAPQPGASRMRQPQPQRFFRV